MLVIRIQRMRCYYWSMTYLTVNSQKPSWHVCLNFHGSSQMRSVKIMTPGSPLMGWPGCYINVRHGGVLSEVLLLYASKCEVQGCPTVALSHQGVTGASKGATN